MWLFTRHGFFSVVQDKRDERLVHARARIKDDLEQLRAFARKVLMVELPEVIATADADYAYRCVIEKPLWQKIATALADNIDYTNFKSEVHGEPDRDNAYLKVWSAMHDLQQKRRR